MGGRGVGRAVLVLLLLTAWTIPAGRPAQAAVVDAVRADAEWILSAQWTDGAIANYVDKQAVWPYLSNFAAMGLSRATEVTNNKRYVGAAWSWLAWYAAHMDAKGFVNDYRWDGAKLVSTGFMDSTDAYAGTFLLAVRDAYRVSGDKNRLTSLKKAIGLAVTAIEATLNADGLTWAKPTWQVKYLMDQGETYAGLLAAQSLATTLRDTTLSKRAASDASKMRTGVARLWNTVAGAYDWAVHSNGARVATDWTLLYPDALQQAWAVAFGLVDDTRAATLISRFGASQPNWALPTAVAMFAGGAHEAVGFWPVAGLAFYRTKDPLGPPGAASIASAALTTNRAWPFTTGNAGQLILLESIGLSGAVTFDGKAAQVVSPTPAPTGTSSPTATPVPPTPSPSPSPTPTPAPSPTPEPTSTPAPTESPTPTPLLPLPSELPVP